MESKKNTFSERVLLLPRRILVVSCFIFCILASFTFFAITFLHTLKPTSFGTANFSVRIENYEGLNENKVIQDNTHVLNFTKSDQIDQYFVPNGEGVVLKNTHLEGNFTGMVNNGSEEEHNVNFTGSNGEEIVTEKKPRFGNISEIMFNGTFFGQGGLIGKVALTNSSKEDISSNIEEVTDSKENSFRKSYDSEKNVNEKMGKDLYQACDVFDGRWVRDDTMPYYSAGSCPHIGRDFNCHLNGRPDDGFLKWRWQPNGCDIPSLNATDFLERLRGQKLVFVGDSLNRNMWQSLVCILRHSIRHKKRVYEISGKSEFKKKGTYAFRFEDYNCTVDFVDAHFLVRESSFKGKNGTFETLRLDLMDQTTTAYQDADVLVFNSGHWWTHEKTSRGEGYYQEGKYVHPRLDALVAYKRALVTWARWIDRNIDRKKTQVFFRGYSMTHFRGGQWNSGGHCNKETDPIFNDTYLLKYPPKMEALEHVLQGMKTQVTYLNISRLTDYRKDGHPSIFREYKTAQERVLSERTQDCSHWCLPGVPDTWNELLYASLLKAGRGSWRS